MLALLAFREAPLLVLLSVAGALDPAIIAEREMLAAERSAAAAEAALYASNGQVWMAGAAFAVSLLSLAVSLHTLIQGGRALAQQSKAARNQLRAYVDIEYGQIDGFRPGSVIRGYAVATNRGATPAKDFTACVHMDFYMGEDYPQCAELDAGIAWPVIDLMPSGEQRPWRELDGPLDAAKIKLIEEGKAGLCVSGHIYFRDIFGVTRKIVFSHLHDGPGLGRRRKDPKMNFARRA